MSTTLKQAFVLIGTQGSGKSATGNSIIGNQFFKSQSGTAALTKEVKEKPLEWQKKDITIIDTPPLKGLPDFTKITDHVEAKYINVKYGFVIAIGRHLPIEIDLLEKICERLHAITDLVLIFTRYDDLDSKDTVNGWLSRCPSLKAFIEKTTVKFFQFANIKGTKITTDQMNDLMSNIIGSSNEVKHNESQTPIHQSTKGNTTKSVKHVGIQTDLKSQHEINDNIIVSRHNLEECFGKYGISFYKEMRKKGAK